MRLPPPRPSERPAKATSSQVFADQKAPAGTSSHRRATFPGARRTADVIAAHPRRGQRRACVHSATSSQANWTFRWGYLLPGPSGKSARWYLLPPASAFFQTVCVHAATSSQANWTFRWGYLLPGPSGKSARWYLLPPASAFFQAACVHAATSSQANWTFRQGYLLPGPQEKERSSAPPPAAERFFSSVPIPIIARTRPSSHRAPRRGRAEPRCLWSAAVKDQWSTRTISKAGHTWPGGGENLHRRAD